MDYLEKAKGFLKKAQDDSHGFPTGFPEQLAIGSALIGILEELRRLNDRLTAIRVVSVYERGKQDKDSDE